MTDQIDRSPDRPQRSFGRKGGRPLSARQQGLVDDLLPSLRVPLGDSASLNPRSLFDTDTAEVWLEIGFGGGEHTTGQAARNPQVGVIGSEVFVEGIAKCLSHIEDGDLKNMRLYDDTLASWLRHWPITLWRASSSCSLIHGPRRNS